MKDFKHGVEDKLNMWIDDDSADRIAFVMTIPIVIITIPFFILFLLGP